MCCICVDLRELDAVQLGFIADEKALLFLLPCVSDILRQIDAIPKLSSTNNLTDGTGAARCIDGGL